MDHRFTYSLIILTLGSLLPSGSHGSEPTAAKKAGEHDVSVKLRLSVDSFDPAEPCGVISCVVRNGTADTLTLPASYDGDVIRIFGQGHSASRPENGPAAGWPLRLYGSDESDATVVLKPGQRRKLFRLRLADILAARDVQGDRPSPSPPTATPNPTERKWSWDWRARPRPPESPIHRFQLPGYMEGADLWAELRLEGQAVSSKKTLLKVRAATETE